MGVRCGSEAQVQECDLVMRGGTTSGIVYPKAIVGLSKRYRFRSIGGASAGAIAAAFAAAAEYGRASDGFAKLDRVPDDFATGLAKYFQPYPAYRKLFAAILKRIEKQKPAGIWFFLRHALKIRRALRMLPDTHFGICPGTTASTASGPGLLDWMNRKLEHVAGRLAGPDGRLPTVPLTFGELKTRGITLRLVSTNLSQRKPENLPVGKGFKLRTQDLDWLLPANVRDWVLGASPPTAGYVAVPHGDDMPVILAVRMSLAFPVLFSTVPLYSPDFSLKNTGDCAGARDVLRINHFSDGGLSSNFPIHYFDAAVPTRPTFGINLSDYHECRQGPDDPLGWNRIYMPSKAGDGVTYGTNPIAGLFEFLGALLLTAKDWQDSVQMRMPGYRERIVHVALKPDEGGLNLTMPKETIDRLIALGERSAERILEGQHGAGSPPFDRPPFALRVHRWRRLLAVTEALDELLERVKKGYLEPAPSGDPGLGPVPEFLDDLIARLPNEPELFKELGYKPPSTADLVNLKKRWEALVALRDEWDKLPLDPSWNLPSPNATVKFRSAQF